MSREGEVLTEEVRGYVVRFSNLVKKFGKDMEVRMTSDERSRSNPKVAFLFDHDSPAYRLYTELLTTGNSVGAEEGASVPPPASSSSTISNPQTEDASCRKKRRFTEGGGRSEEASSGKPVDISVLLNQEGSGGKVEHPSKEDAERGTEEERPVKSSRRSSGKGKGSSTTPEVGGYGRYIPKEVLNEFMAKSRGEAMEEKKEEALKIDEANVGHQLLSSMGWTEGAGLGKEQTGLVDAVTTKVKTDKAGLGAETEADPLDVTPADDEFEQYRKRMMLAYRYRPNPLNNPRKGYGGYETGRSQKR